MSASWNWFQMYMSHEDNIYYYKHNIDNKILTFPGHVVVATNYSDGSGHVLDADFGVVIPISADELKNNSNTVTVVL